MTGWQFKDLLKQQGYTNAYVAKEIGVSASTLGRFLNGEVELNKSKYYRLCSFLGLDLWY
ncbi:helix-turn-helix transcriptional regulator [Bacillus sp. SM2101]|uniref:helix-turn-helix domain-containing protein n=1 Tax=Bacillus sp. SM2101 TaxID=2805366 RepID=UPI001BDE41BE|nr:helix-turn-helix transcriptional regulator [Bacillus sp. SM2101]